MSTTPTPRERARKALEQIKAWGFLPLDAVDHQLQAVGIDINLTDEVELMIRTLGAIADAPESDTVAIPRELVERIARGAGMNADELIDKIIDRVEAELTDPAVQLHATGDAIVPQAGGSHVWWGEKAARHSANMIATDGTIKLRERYLHPSMMTPQQSSRSRALAYRVLPAAVEATRLEAANAIIKALAGAE